MKQFNRLKGSIGEDIAADHLRKNGFRIIEKNYSSRYGEIDLIASKNNHLHFIEVKLKVGDRFGKPEDMISKYKVNKVLRMAEVYLLSNTKYSRMSPQIDVVAVVTEDGDTKRITHYENVSLEFL